MRVGQHGGMSLSVGDRAPEFSLPDQDKQVVSLADLRGTPVLLVFYPFAFSGICTGELCEIRDNLGAFVSDDVQVLAISTDHMFSQRAWADKEGYFFPLLSDFWPHGAAAESFGVLNEQAGAALRGTFLLDREGVVRWTLINEIGQGRDFTGYHEALRELSA